MFPSRKFIVIFAVLVLVCAGGYIAFRLFSATPEPAVVEQMPIETHKTIGYSVEGRAIEAYTFGMGGQHLLFVGGMHGGYEWNSVLLAYQAIDYLHANPAVIPADIAVTIVPNANPDAVYDVVGKEGRFTAANVAVGEHTQARFNAHGVDLNRNFDCKWQPESTWRSAVVSAGTAPFSEPESQAIRDIALKLKPQVVVFWHSQANAVYASECTAGILPETFAATNIYAQAAGYPAISAFDAYEVTGDAEGWLASVGIPAITVELSTHEAIEWEKNLAGIQALFARYSQGL